MGGKVRTTLTAVDSITEYFKTAKSKLKIFSPLANDNYVSNKYIMF